MRFGLLICEDAWFDEPARRPRRPAPRCCACSMRRRSTSARSDEREAAHGRSGRVRCSMPLLYAHLVGGQDEVVFDGASFAVDAHGRWWCARRMFEEGCRAASRWTTQYGTRRVVARAGPRAQAWAALVMGVRDYIGKNGFPGVDHRPVGRHRLGAGAGDRGRCAGRRPGARGDDAIALHRRHLLDRRARHGPAPGRALRRDLDRADVRRLSHQPGAANFAGLAEDATEENIQARIRGTLLMALSNKFGSIVLTTGNKSEMATGYCTLYGDMAGGFAVIKDVAKTLVYRLAAWKKRPGRGGDPAAHHHARPVRRVAPRPDRPGQPAALRGARRDLAALHGRRPGHRRRSWRRASTPPTSSGSRG